MGCSKYLGEYSPKFVRINLRIFSRLARFVSPLTISFAGVCIPEVEAFLLTAWICRVREPRPAWAASFDLSAVACDIEASSLL